MGLRKEFQFFAGNTLRNIFELLPFSSFQLLINCLPSTAVNTILEQQLGQHKVEMDMRDVK